MLTFMRHLSTSTSAVKQLLSQPMIKKGVIRSIAPHPDAESLYVSNIDASGSSGKNGNGEGEGEGEQLYTVVSGLKPYYTLDQLCGRPVTLLTNLKPAKLRGVTSQAMILAASVTASDRVNVELVNPPESSPVGEQLEFQGALDEPAKSTLKSKNWRSIQSSLFTNEQCQVEVRMEDGTRHLLVNSAGEPCTVESAQNAPVS